MTKEEFEKEAEERARKLEESQTLGVYNSDEELAQDVGWNTGEVSGYKDGFNDGAEYVYNKCNIKLTKAKELIKKLVNEFYYLCELYNFATDYECLAEAEQFLNKE